MNMKVLDELEAAIPTVPQNEVYEWIGRLECARARLWARVTSPVPTADKVEQQDNLLTVDEAAAVVKQSRRWIYKHAKNWRFTKRPNQKTLLINERRLRAWLESRP